MKKRLIPILISLLTLVIGFGNLHAAGEIVPCDPETFATDSISIQTSDCAVDAKFCVPLPLADLPNYQYIVDDVVYTGNTMGCDFDTITAYTYATLFGMGNAGPYNVDSWMVNGFNITGTFNDIPDLITFMNNNDPGGNWVDMPASSLIVGGNPNNTYTEIDVTVVSINTPSFIGYNFGVEAQGTLIDLPVGRHEVIVVDIPNVCQDTIIVNVGCITPEYITDIVQIGESDTLCLDFTELSGPPVSVTDFCPASADGDVSFSFIFSNTCIAYTGNAVGQDSFCVVACDAAGLCDTTVLFVQVPGIPGGSSTTIYDTLLVNQIDIYCIDTTMIGSSPFTTTDLCLGASGTYTDFSVDPVSFCVFYQGLNSIGTDSLCVEVCGASSCDTTYLYVTVLPEPPMVMGVMYDTVFVNQNSTFCPDTTVLAGNIDSISNICSTMSGNSVIFTPDPMLYCMNFNAFDVGCDTACVVIGDDLGNFDTTSLVVCVLEPSPQVIYDTIFLGNSNTYCIDSTELAGNIVSIDNFCDTLSGNSVDFQINAINLCIDGQAVDLGTDTACIVICDDFGICDSTTYIVTVIDPSISPPVAFNDVDTTSLNQPIGINYCGNDIIPDNMLTSFGLLDIVDGGVGPLPGASVIFNIDCTLTFVPQNNFCGGVDSFSYTICNAVGCDTATVAVYVECQPENGEFEIHNAFSPNGDAVNDYFQIDGIENFANHELCIYNRWGNQVLRTENYQNDWEGQWEGNDLPSGTYFYVFNDGNGNTHSGYVQIMR